MKQREF